MDFKEVTEMISKETLSLKKTKWGTKAETQCSKLGTYYLDIVFFAHRTGSQDLKKTIPAFNYRSKRSEIRAAIFQKWALAFSIECIHSWDKYSLYQNYDRDKLQLEAFLIQYTKRRRKHLRLFQFPVLRSLVLSAVVLYTWFVKNGFFNTPCILSEKQSYSWIWSKPSRFDGALLCARVFLSISVIK